MIIDGGFLLWLFLLRNKLFSTLLMFVGVRLFLFLFHFRVLFCVVLLFHFCRSFFFVCLFFALSLNLSVFSRALVLFWLFAVTHPDFRYTLFCRSFRFPPKLCLCQFVLALTDICEFLYYTHIYCIHTHMYKFIWFHAQSLAFDYCSVRNRFVVSLALVNKRMLETSIVLFDEHYS